MKVSIQLTLEDHCRAEAAVQDVWLGVCQSCLVAQAFNRTLPDLAPWTVTRHWARDNRGIKVSLPPVAVAAISAFDRDSTFIPAVFDVEIEEQP